MALRRPASSSTTMTIAPSFLFNSALPCRQADVEAGTAGCRRPGLDGTAVGLYDGAAHRESQTCSGFFCRRERIEQSIQDLRRYSRAIVHYANLHVTQGVW